MGVGIAKRYLLAKPCTWSSASLLFPLTTWAQGRIQGWLLGGLQHALRRGLYKPSMAALVGGGSTNQSRRDDQL